MKILRVVTICILALVSVFVLSAAEDAAQADASTAAEESVAAEAPGPEELCGAITAAADLTPEVTLDTLPRLIDADGLKTVRPDLTSITEGYRFCWAVEAYYRLGDTAASNCLTVIRMDSQLDAFGPFSMQRSKQATAVPIPVSAYWLSDGLHVWRGSYYLFACTPPDGADAQQKAIRFVTEIVKAIPIPDRMPMLLRVLPWRARQVSQPQYVRRSVLGLPFLKNGMKADYIEGETTCRLVVMRHDSVGRAAEIYARLAASLLSEGSVPEPVEQMGDAAARLDTDRYGDCMIILEEEFVAAVLDYHDEEFASELLRATGSNIRIFLLARE